MDPLRRRRGENFYEIKECKAKRKEGEWITIIGFPETVCLNFAHENWILKGLYLSGNELHLKYRIKKIHSHALEHAILFEVLEKMYGICALNRIFSIQ